jgi:hypothetical protein
MGALRGAFGLREVIRCFHAHHGDVAWRGDGKPHLVAANLHYRDFNVLSDPDGLSRPPCQHQHRGGFSRFCSKIFRRRIVSPQDGSNLAGKENIQTAPAQADQDATASER